MSSGIHAKYPPLCPAVTVASTNNALPDGVTATKHVGAVLM